jgi:dTDP-4-amino-4,6-dideoxygalactose transaminase
MVDLQGQYLKIKDEIDIAIQEVIDSTAFINGPAVKSFQSDLEKYLGVKHVIPCANGTDSLQVSMMALGLKPGDEVITASFTFIATAEVIALLGLTPVVVDVDPDTFNIDPAAIERAVTSRTKAIVPVHLFGQCADMEAINAIAGKHNLYVIEDTCQAIGAEYIFKDGTRKKAGTIGHASGMSFFPSKNLGCYGDGGAVVTNDEKLADRVRKLRDHGRVTKYEHDELGYGHRIDALQTAILGAKLPHLDDWNEGRRLRAATYDELLADTSLITPQHLPETTPVYHCYTVRTPNRDAVVKSLQTAGIGVGVHYPIPLHLQPAYRFLELGEGSYPVTEQMSAEVMSLPIYAELTEAQQDEVVAAVKEALVGFSE